MKKIMILVVVLAAFTGIIWYSNYGEHLTGFVQQYVENGEFTTLKAKYTPEQIMETNRQELLVDPQHSYQEPFLKFLPYLLMEVKYTKPDKKSREGLVLWSLTDGEMVTSTEGWEKTHGFQDAIKAGANSNDFKLMHALSKNKDGLTQEHLLRDLHLEKETLTNWIESASSKHLIVQKGNQIQLHFQDPKILVEPETKITDWLVKKPYNHAQRIPNTYSISQVQKIAKAAFGDDFTIRSAKEIYLPIYSIDVLNPDGSIFTSYWNAVTGKRIYSTYSSSGW